MLNPRSLAQPAVAPPPPPAVPRYLLYSLPSHLPLQLRVVMGPENGIATVRSLSRFIWNIKNVLWTNGIREHSQDSEAVEHWSSFHDNYQVSHSHKYRKEETRCSALLTSLRHRARNLPFAPVRCSRRRRRLNPNLRRSGKEERPFCRDICQNSATAPHIHDSQ